MKASIIVKGLNEMIAEHGDLDVTIHAVGCDSEVVRSDHVFVCHDEYKVEADKIDIRTFPY